MNYHGPELTFEILHHLSPTTTCPICQQSCKQMDIDYLDSCTPCFDKKQKQDMGIDMIAHHGRTMEEVKTIEKPCIDCGITFHFPKNPAPTDDLTRCPMCQLKKAEKGD